jgi:diguanylate cyclase (GGDEF)-like protein
MHDASPLGIEGLMQFLYQAPIGLVQAALDGRITMINPMSAQLLMPLAPQGELSNLFDVLQSVAPQLRLQALAAEPGDTVCEGLRLRVRAAHRRPESDTWLSLRMLRLDADTLMASISDITAEARQERERVATEVRDAGRTDALTGLANRSVALEHIQAAMAAAWRAPVAAHPAAAVLFINGDRFNRVNLRLGPAAGDELLRLMAARITASLRQRSAGQVPRSNAWSAARLGADEFVVVLEDLCDAQAGVVVAQRLVDALNQPFRVGGAPVHGSASVGVVLRPGFQRPGDAAAEAAADGTAAAEAVLQDASLAMREAKRCGGARWCVFEPALRTGAQRRASLESELRQALLDDQLFAVYQPISHLTSGAVHGMEALVRWQHPQRGVVPPLDFIGVAEDSGLIVPLGRRVLMLACQQLALWRQQLGELAPRVMSVNLSRAQLAQPGLLDTVREALHDSGLEAGCLQLEITESLAAEDAGIQARLHQLKRLGVLLALDDFGTGYSSLSSLHQWPVDVIKIDRSFVSQIDTSPHHRVLVEATMLVARSLGMLTVAEGVETAAQARVLAELRCDKVQGYLYAPPMRGPEATAWLQANGIAPRAGETAGLRAAASAAVSAGAPAAPATA